MNNNTQPPFLGGAVDLSRLLEKKQTTSEQKTSGSVSVASLIFDATEANFQAVLELSQTVPVVIDLWATWCEPCKQLTPVLEKLVTEFSGKLLLAKVDVDENVQIAQAFQATSIPTIVAIIAGQPVPLFTGAVPEAEVRVVFEQLLELARQHNVSGVAIPSDTEDGTQETVVSEPERTPLQLSAQKAFDNGDWETAITDYTQALAQNPRDTLASTGIVTSKLMKRLSGYTRADVFDNANGDTRDVESHLACADFELLDDDPVSSFDRLLTLFATATAEQKTIVRQRLLEFFEIVGPDIASVNEARRRLTSLLF